MGVQAAAPRRPARDIIDAVVDNMRKNLEPLKYSTLAPSRYTVYLHASEFARLEGIIPILREQTMRALSEELQSLNRSSSMRRLVKRWRPDPGPEIRNAAARRQGEFPSGPGGDMDEGNLPNRPEPNPPANPGPRRRQTPPPVTTVRVGQETTTQEHSGPRTVPIAAGPAVFAKI